MPHFLLSLGPDPGAPHTWSLAVCSSETLQQLIKMAPHHLLLVDDKYCPSQHCQSYKHEYIFENISLSLVGSDCA